MNEIEQAYEDNRRAVAAQDFEKASAHWRRFVELLEQQPNPSPAGGGAKHRQPAMAPGSGDHDTAAGSTSTSSEGPGAGNLSNGAGDA